MRTRRPAARCCSSSASSSRVGTRYGFTRVSWERVCSMACATGPKVSRPARRPSATAFLSGLSQASSNPAQPSGAVPASTSASGSLAASLSW